MKLRRLRSIGTVLMIGFSASAFSAPLIYVSSEKDDTLTIIDQVRRPENATASRRHIGAQRSEQVAPRLWVEADAGLVHQQHGRSVQQRAHQFDLAPGAAR